MALMTEEAALLVEKGICELYKLPKINEKPTEKEKQEILAQEQKYFTVSKVQTLEFYNLLLPWCIDEQEMTNNT